MPTQDDSPAHADVPVTPTLQYPESTPFKVNVKNALALLQLRPGDHLNDYQGIDLEIQRVAHGGFGLVFLGFDHGSQRPMVLKTLRPDLLAAATDPERLAALFVREALVWVGLWPHMNILTAQFITHANGAPFLVLDYATKGSLRDTLKTPPYRYGHPLPLRLALSWAQHIAAGLVAIHTPDPEHMREQPLVHRDLKPENVLVNVRVSERGTLSYLRITDFGLAKVALDMDGDLPEVLAAADDSPLAASTRSQRLQTRRGVAMGTLAYMAPEQWADAATVGPPADMYAFGLMLSELFAGRGALLDLDQRHSVDEWRSVHEQREPRPLREIVPEVPEEVETLYHRLLAKRAGERPTAVEALAALQAAVRAIGRTPYTPPEVPHTPERERLYWQSWTKTNTRLGLHTAALKRVEQELAMEPGNPQALHTRGSILYQLGRLDEALVDFDAAFAAIPAEQVQQRGSTYVARGQLFMRMKRYAEAEADFAEALTLRPDDPSLWYKRALNQSYMATTAAKGKQRAEAREYAARALEYVERALAFNPNDPLYQQLATIVRNLMPKLERIQGGSHSPTA